MKLIKISPETGLFIEDVILDEVPVILNWKTSEEGYPIQPEVMVGEDIPPMYIPDPSYIAMPCPDGYYKPCWDFELEQWYDAATPEEIEAINGAAVIPEPTLEERQDQVEAALIELAAIVTRGM